MEICNMGEETKFKEIIYEVKDGVAWITINRPEVQNAFREQTLDELIDAFQSTNITKFGQVSGQARTMHAINDADKTLWGAGSEEHWGIIGNNSRNGSNSSPVQIPGTTWRSIYTGGRGSIATKTDGTLWSWGYNVNGLIGQNNTSRL